MAKKTTPPPLPRLRPLPIRIARLHAKLLIAVVIGFVVAISTMPFELRWLARALIGWDVGIAVYLALTYSMMWRTDVERIRKRAAEQDEGAAFILTLSIVATFASFIAIVFALGGSKQAMPAEAAAHVLLAIATIVLSWTFVHTIFTFHYAHEYYSKRRDDRIGGLIFPYDEHPDYRDFLYFSLVIGMTSQTSDVDICSKVIRRMAAIHGVLSFFFNLVVLALTVNMVANFI
jgi:uncharacterized membrane protein